MKHILLIIFTLFLFASNAQELKFGKISKDELSQQVHPKDSSAHAAVIYKSEDIYFFYTESNGFVQHREIHERIKIYDKHGFDWATKKIYLYEGDGGDKEKITNVKGYTYNLNEGKIQKVKLKKEGVFEEDYNDFTEINTITMPDIREGSVIEYSYKIISPFLVIDNIIFQYNIPNDKFDLRVKTPKYYSFNSRINPKAFYYPNIKRSTTDKSQKFLSSRQTPSTSVITNTRQPGQSTLKYKENVITANEVNIPALRVEAYAGNIDNYRSKLIFELSAILNQFGTIERSFSTDWNRVCKSINKSESFGGQLNRSNFYNKDIGTIVAQGENDFQKALLLQSFVKSKVRWNGNYGYMAQNGIKKAYNEGEGNVADVNLLLIAMLKSQGINANPVLVSTRDNGIPIYPTRKGF